MLRLFTVHAAAMLVHSVTLRRRHAAQPAGSAKDAQLGGPRDCVGQTCLSEVSDG